MEMDESKLQDEIREELERVGIDPKNIEDMQADFAWARRSRKSQERFSGWVRIGFLSAGLSLGVQVVRYLVKGEW